MSVYKYKLNSLDPIHILKVPVGTKFLCCQMKEGELCLWALVDTHEYEKEEREIHICATGGPCREGMIYIGTVQQPPFVWHIFDNGVYHE